LTLQALATLRARLAEQPPASPRSKAMHAELGALSRRLGFGHWAAHAEEACFKRFPVTRQPL